MSSFRSVSEFIAHAQNKVNDVNNFYECKVERTNEFKCTGSLGRNNVALIFSLGLDQYGREFTT